MKKKSNNNFSPKPTNKSVPPKSAATKSMARRMEESVKKIPSTPPPPNAAMKAMKPKINDFAALERDLPKGGGKQVMKMAEHEGVEKVAKEALEQGAGKWLKRAAIGAGILTPVGLGINALVEGLDSEEAGGEDEDLHAAEMRQAEKSAALIPKKQAMPVKSLEASTKKQVPKALPKAVKKPSRDEQFIEKFEAEGKRYNPEFKVEEARTNFIPEPKKSQGYNGPKPNPHVEISGLENVHKVMKDEFKKGAARYNRGK